MKMYIFIAFPLPFRYHTRKDQERRAKHYRKYTRAGYSKADIIRPHRRKKPCDIRAERTACVSRKGKERKHTSAAVDML